MRKTCLTNGCRAGNRSRLLLRRIAIALTAAVTFCASPVVAQPYPNKPIRFLLPQAPGGIADITCRLVAQKMTESLGQQVVIENRPSAGAVVAAEMVAKAEPDGYTLLQTGSGTASAQSLFKSLPYDLLADFAQVSTMAFFDFVVLVSVDSNFRSVADVIAFAKRNPGKLNIGTINIGSGQYGRAGNLLPARVLAAFVVPSLHARGANTRGIGYE